jgi:hypothetical protein
MRRVFVLATAAVALSVLASIPTQASDGDVRLFFDPNQCSGTIPCGETRQLFVYVELGGATSSGITGVEFGTRLGMDGAADAGWLFAEAFSPGATVALGTGAFSPPDQNVVVPPRYRRRGANVAWGSCQTGDGGLVHVETVNVTNLGCGPAELRLLVTSHDTPRNAFFQCPLAVLCDAPVYTKVCLGGDVVPCPNPDAPGGPPAHCSTSGEAVINPVENTLSPCRITAVEPATWSGVKSLYQD